MHGSIYLIKLILKNEIGDNTMFCPMCNKNVNYKIITEIIDEYRGYKVNVKQNIAVCDNCGERIYVSELENENLKNLYQKYRDKLDAEYHGRIILAGRAGLWKYLDMHKIIEESFDLVENLAK